METEPQTDEMGIEEPQIMSDSELVAILRDEEVLAVNFEFASDQAQRGVRDYDQGASRDALDYYEGNAYPGDDSAEMAGRSKVVSRDVAEVVDWAIPELVKMFDGKQKLGEFGANHPEREEQARDASDYVSHCLTQDNDSFTLIHDQIKDGLLQRVGVARVYWDPRGDAARETLEGLGEEGLTLLHGDQEINILEVWEDGYGGYGARIEKRPEGRLVAENIPPEQFRVARRAGDIDKNCPYCAIVQRKTASDLIVDGFEEDVVKGLSDTDSITASSIDLDLNERNSAREWAAREYWLYEEYIRVDIDDDGETELIKVLRVGETILSREEVSEHGIVAWSPNRMPHRVIGRSVADDARDIQDVKTALWRDGLDNIALANNPQKEVETSNLDPNTIPDLLDWQYGGIIRVKKLGTIREIGHTNISGAVLPMIEHADSVREQRTGISRHNQGLDADTMHDTKGGSEQLLESGQARRDLIARNYACALEKLMCKSLRILIRHQDRERMIKVRGEWAPIDPRGWDATMSCSVAVGLGAGSQASKQRNAMMLLELQREGYQAGMVTQEQLFAGVTQLVETLELGEVNQYFGLPEGQQQEKPDPAVIEAQGKMQMEQAKLQMQMQSDAARFEMDRELAANRLAMEREVKMLELEMRREEMKEQIRLKEAEIAFKSNINTNLKSPVPS